MSGNVNVGFVDGRSSSRVLKPPGGGYSEIFFTQYDENDLPKRVAPPKRTETLIESILRTEETKSTTVKTDHNGTKSEVSESSKNIEEKVEALAIGDEPKEENHAAIEPKPVTSAPQPDQAVRRVRVPPGGFSSGLW